MFASFSLFRQSHSRGFYVAEMGSLRYDITRYQPVLFAARSTNHLVDALSSFFGAFDDDVYGRLNREAA